MKNKEIPVFYSQESFKHQPDFELLMGQRLPYQETTKRVAVILQALRKAGFAQINATTVGNMPWLEQVHDSAYLKFLEETSREAARMEATDPSRRKVVLYPSTFLHASKVPDTSGLSLEARLGVFMSDTFAPITEETHEAALGSVACAVAGAKLVLEGEKFVYSLCRPPGHHAERARAGGYCYINNAAVAAEVLKSGGAGKVAILDFDLHHGNGTQNIFWGRPDICFVSIHASPKFMYPYYSGYKDEVGEGEGKGNILNIPLPKGIGADFYHSAAKRAIEKIASFKADFLVISAGFDTNENDPFLTFDLPSWYYLKLGQAIATLKLPTAVIQEGGYGTERLGVNVVSFLSGLTGLQYVSSNS